MTADAVMMPDSTELVDVINEKVYAAIEADEGGDVTSAYNLMNQAAMAMMGIPDGSREEEEFEFDRESINAKVAELKRRATAGCGTQSFGARYARG